jgi:hypothetical protein
MRVMARWHRERTKGVAGCRKHATGQQSSRKRLLGASAIIRMCGA